jgi:hypothetical protein
MNLYIATALMLFGVGVHFLSVLADLEESGQSMTPWGYLRQHPYRAALMVCASFILLLVANELHQVTQLTAVLIGFTCQEANDRLRRSANAKLSTIGESP